MRIDQQEMPRNALGNSGTSQWTTAEYTQGVLSKNEWR